MNEVVKICKIHGDLTIDQVHKEKNSALKSGYQIRCAQCRRDKDRKWKLNNLDKHRASAGAARKEARRLYREGLTDIKPKSNIWATEDRLKNPEKYKKWAKTYRDNKGQLRNTEEICRRLDLDVSEYYKMLAEQKGVCAICNKLETKKSRTEGKICQLSIDHNHTTGQIRSLLCHHCNAAIGHLNEDTELLQKAITYLKSHQQ